MKRCHPSDLPVDQRSSPCKDPGRNGQDDCLIWHIEGRAYHLSRQGAWVLEIEQEIMPIMQLYHQICCHNLPVTAAASVFQITLEQAGVFYDYEQLMCILLRGGLVRYYRELEKILAFMVQGQ